jgi:hypothetical protein
VAEVHGGGEGGGWSRVCAGACVWEGDVWWGRGSGMCGGLVSGMCR